MELNKKSSSPMTTKSRSSTSTTRIPKKKKSRWSFGLPTWIKVLITEDDNETLSPVYSWAALSFIVGTVCTIAGWIFKHPFPIVEYTTFVGGTLVSMGAARRLEPPQDKTYVDKELNNVRPE